MALSSSLDSPSANATDNVCYTVDHCSCFSSLPIENAPVMKANIDKAPADRTVTESSVPTLAGEAVTTPTYMESMFLLMELPLNFPYLIAQPLPFCVKN